VQLVAPAALNRPVGQLTQAVAGSLSWSMVPAAHGVQSTAPTSLNVPAGHKVHSAMPGSPATHPAGQLSHVTTVPSMALTVPAAHGAHGVDGSRSSSRWPGGHTPHPAGPPGPNVPEAQTTHAVAALWSWSNVPATHGWHVVPPPAE
jgi:hypothetical protein